MPELLSDSREEVFLLGELKLRTALTTFVSLYTPKKSVLLYRNRSALRAGNLFFCSYYSNDGLLKAHLSISALQKYH